MLFFGLSEALSKVLFILELQNSFTQYTLLYAAALTRCNLITSGHKHVFPSFFCSGDVIVYINDICVLGTTHADVVKLFQSVPIGQSVTLVLCRGYPLPFDPEAGASSLTPIGMEHRPLVVNGRGGYDPYLEYLSLSSQLQPPGALGQSPGAAGSHPMDTHLDGSSLPLTTSGLAPPTNPHEDNVSMASSGVVGGGTVGTTQGPELLTVTMVKGMDGFGFTIADSPTGQRVKQVNMPMSPLNWFYSVFFIVYVFYIILCICNAFAPWSMSIILESSVQWGVLESSVQWGSISPRLHLLYAKVLCCVCAPRCIGILNGINNQ